jgi:hypothetical protein
MRAPLTLKMYIGMKFFISYLWRKCSIFAAKLGSFYDQ